MYIAFALTVGCGHVVVAQVYDQEDGSKSLKLGDFGLAIHYDGQRLLKSVCGTPTYVAPEVIAEEGYVGGHPSSPHTRTSVPFAHIAVVGVEVRHGGCVLLCCAATTRRLTYGQRASSPTFCSVASRHSSGT